MQQFQPYRNFLPNYSLGVGPLVTAWDIEVEEPEMVEVARPVHNMGHNDEPEGGPPPPGGLAAQPLAEPSTELKGAVEDLIKGHGTKIREGDMLSPKVDEGVDDFLQKALTEPQFAMESEKLTKTFHRVESVPGMTVPRIDEEVYQVINHKVKGLDQNMQAWQRG